MQALHLPLTILDQGKVRKSLNTDKISEYVELYGRILKSTPFILGYQKNHQTLTDLPDFFSVNKTRDSKILGQFCYTIGNDYQEKTEINLLVKCNSRKNRECELIALFDCREESNEDYAKVLLELLVLLLASER